MEYFDIVVCWSSDQSSLDRVRALEEQLQAAELKKREIQQELREAQQTAQDAHR